ncbi:unnamed protein product [Staurois parvus]|uniref:Fibronectin type-III domain-containing protein n=1 Tax=Staurois parvus TaxID=386267 RepID=A0ABN9F761_9NEOB|nr:unnamed protein product [Staurois parvus]
MHMHRSCIFCCFVCFSEAEARYLIAVKPNENHKTCKEKNSSQKPLQVVIGSLTPTSVYLSWGILINPQIDWSALSKCPNDRFYTVRYKEKNKDWNFQLCPTTEAVVDNLKPNTMYEFGVKDNSDDEIWSKPQNHKTSPKGKENGNIENTYKIPKGTLQYATEDTKALIPVIIVKQGFQNISKPTAAPPPTVQSPVFREETKKPPLTTTRPTTPKPKPASKVTVSLPIPNTSEKTIAEDPKPAPIKTKVSESEVLSSTEEQHTKLEVTMAPNEQLPQSPIPAQTRPTVYLASPTMSPVSFTKELPIVQPETVLGEEPISSEPPQHQSSTVSSDLLPEPHRTIASKASPTMSPVSFTKELPIVQPEAVLAGEEPISSEVPQLQSSTVSSDLLPEPHRTIAGKGDVPEFIDVPQVSTDMPIKLRTTSGKGMHPKSTLVSKLSTHLPFQKHTTTLATTSQFIPVKQSTMSSQTHKKTTTAFIGIPNIVTTPKSIVRTTVQNPMPVPNEILSVHPKPVPSTEAPESEADSTLPESKIITTDAPHTYEPEKSTLASDDRIVVQKHTSTSKSHTTIAYRTRTTSFTTNTPTTSQRTQSTLASKRERVSPAQPKIPLPKKTQPTTVPVKTQKIPHKKDHSTVGPTPQTGKTEKDVSPKPHKTSQSPPTTAVPKPAQTAKMPIKPIIHIFSDPALPSVQSETQTTAPPIPKTTQSNKIPESKPAPKTTKKVSIHVISLQIFDKPDVPMVPNTTLTPQATTTQRPESPHTTPVPVQKVSQPITQKPKPSPRTRTKPAPTAAPKETTTLPKIPHVTAAATLATYRVQHSSSRPRTSLRPRTRPAQNGTTQGSSRPRPTGDFSWVPGTIPGGRVLDSTKLLGVSRNISMEPNNTGKRTFSVSSPPLPPVKPTSIRRRFQYNNVTGRPRVTVSSPPLSPVKPTTIRRRPPANATAKPVPTVDPNVFNTFPKSDVDTVGKQRYTGSHVLYINKKENRPCSITDSLKHFPTEESTNQDISTPPQNPPSNLTVVTVEGCSSFVILDWEMPNNDTATEFKVISTENGAPEGKNQSIITTNQTYSTVENLKPDTR